MPNGASQRGSRRASWTLGAPMQGSRRASLDEHGAGARRGSIERELSEWPAPLHSDKVSTETLLITAIKFADLGHCFKPWELHRSWSERVTEEFWRLGDLERTMGLPTGPLCDRQADHNIPKSQGGFFQFVCTPFYTAVASLLPPGAPFLAQLEANDKEWKRLLQKQTAEEQAARAIFKGDKGGEAEGSPPRATPPTEPGDDSSFASKNTRRTSESSSK